MGKNNIFKILLQLVFVVIFNVIFFLLGNIDSPFSVWFSYGFIMFSYLMVIITQFMIRPSKNAVLGLFIYLISTVYFITELVIGIVFVFMKLEAWKIPFAIQLVIFGIYLVILIFSMMSNENTINNTERQSEEIAYIKDASSRVKSLMGKLTEKKVDRSVEHIYDLLHTSPTRSNLSVYGLEREIIKLVSDLEYAIDLQNTDEVFEIENSIVKQVNERNRILRNSNL